MSRLVWLIPLFPLAGAVVNALLGRLIGHKAHWLAVSAPLASFVTSCFVFNRVWHGETWTGDLFPWVVAEPFHTAVTAQVDQLTAVMLLVVTGVGFLIHVYSVGYMHGDGGYARFFTYMNLFVFSMVMLVLAGNFLVLYVFWEAVGLCSYLLIGFWYEKQSASDAGKKAFIVNRVGDFGFGLGIMLIWVTFGTLTYSEVFAKADGSVGGGVYLAIALLLFMGATGKSAQLPLFTWLPDAMEGPTPVSALIHAATMVTAGVYMVARCHKLFEMAPLSLEIVAWVGGLTAVFAATIGLVQTDIKRVLAYSTISQLGYMFVGVGVGAYSAGIFHLISHAFFKALLFLGAGSVIHGLGGEQDLRKMGGLAPRMMTTTVTFLVGAFGLAGVPPLSGFFSKDEILASVFHEHHYVLWLLLMVGAFLTAFYTFRLVFLAFFGGPRMSKEVAHHIHESPASMTVPLIVLAILTVVAGLAVGIPSSHGTAFARFLSPVLPLDEAEHSAGVAFSLLVLSALVAISGVAVAWLVYGRSPARATSIGVARNPVHRLLLNGYYVDQIYDAVIVKPIYHLSLWFARIFDPSVIDGIVNGVAAAMAGWARGLRRVQTGFVMNYAFGILLGAVAVVAYLLTRR
ncbi:MAG TPA: NADH-quinone oxidoreductase subunit L [Methylomirabilota bacterium]|jgi:NADH-quinone oxidoreductase subunit L|nr:NADH-quinone oxidoreductase subunit L [Methylomirabilota bacterium]